MRRDRSCRGPVMPRAGGPADIRGAMDGPRSPRVPDEPWRRGGPEPGAGWVGTFVRPRLPALTDHALPRRGSRRSGGVGFGENPEEVAADQFGQRVLGHAAP